MTETPMESDEEIERDPVCGAQVDLDDAEEHGLATSFEGRAYVFCGPDCRTRFDHAPLRYACAGRAEP